MKYEIQESRTLGQKAVSRFHNGVIFSRVTKTQLKIERAIEESANKVFNFPNLE